MCKKLLIMVTCFMGWLFMIYIGSNDFMKNIIKAQSAPVFTLPKGANIIIEKLHGISEIMIITEVMC